jgi:preprotein translocase subunit SecG
LEYKDGGFGDLDGVANGVIIDPSGPGAAAAGGGGGGGGYFISTTATGFSKSSAILAMVLLFSLLFIGFSGFRRTLKK